MSKNNYSEGVEEFPKELTDELTFNSARMQFRKETETDTCQLVKLIFTYKMGDSSIVIVFNESDDEYKGRIIESLGLKAWFTDCALVARRKVTTVLMKKLEKLKADWDAGLSEGSPEQLDNEIPDNGIVQYN